MLRDLYSRINNKISTYPLPHRAAIIVGFIELHGVEIGMVMCLCKYRHCRFLEIDGGTKRH